MAMDQVAFRESFPEFTDESKYTEAMLTFWSSIGEKLLNEERWGDLLTHGLYLFVAHNIVLHAADIATSDKGKLPGQSLGIASSKSIGGANVTYDLGAFSLRDAGNYNMTKYGRDFWSLMNIIGMGGAQV